MEEHRLASRKLIVSSRVVWNYISHSPQVLGCERLPNGNTLLAEQGPSQAVEVTPHGDIVSTVPLPTSEKPYHRQIRNIHKLSNGHILAAIEAEGAAREVDAEGKVVWEHTGLADVFEALRLSNGNTLIACGTQRRVIEVTPDHRVVWEADLSGSSRVKSRLDHQPARIGQWQLGHRKLSAGTGRERSTRF